MLHANGRPLFSFEHIPVIGLLDTNNVENWDLEMVKNLV